MKKIVYVFRRLGGIGLCLICLANGFGQDFQKDSSIQTYLNQIPEESRSNPDIVKAIERVRILRANRGRLGKKHPSYESVQKQVDQAEQALEGLIKKYTSGEREGESATPKKQMPNDSITKNRNPANPLGLSPDPIENMQRSARESGFAPWGYWGGNPETYSSWKDHTNRLVPIYVLGSDLSKYRDKNSVYRDPNKIQYLYGRVPENTLNPNADYMDLTDLYDLQRNAVESGGKKYIFLVVFDGLDFDTLRASAIYKKGEVGYEQGRGTGLVFQDFDRCVSDFAYAVTSPYGREITVDVDAQRLIENPTQLGGYDPKLGGASPWEKSRDRDYLFGKSRLSFHAVTDSSAAASSMVTGRKIINATLNITNQGDELETIGRWVQREKNFEIGVVTTVPFCHATPAAAYAVNVSRNDYQDIARDMLGLPSVSHRVNPLPGMDVVIGCGAMDQSESEISQGLNYIPGNPYISEADLEQIASNNYVVARRTQGVFGKSILDQAVEHSILQKKRLFGFFGVKFGHLPFQTANEDFASVGKSYSQQDRLENPNLSDFTEAAIRRLETNQAGFWLLIEAGDVDLAAHENDIDRLIGSVLQGEKAVEIIIQWIESNHFWDESLLIIASDHGHGFHLADPTAFARARSAGK
jgi:alkaline phosphatase